MVISQLIGGLGNQMFQYAVGRALALERECFYKLDISGFANYGLHQGFELQRIFNAQVVIASEQDICKVLGWQARPIIKKIVSRSVMQAMRRKALVIEPHYDYWDEINNSPRNCYLSGYWQSEKYFTQAAQKIREDFTFKLPMSPQNAELVQQINQVNAVSLHVRRGDYVSNQKNLATYQLCSLDYYQAAIQHIAERIERPNFYIFSDDMAWVKSNLKLDFPHQYVEHNQSGESYNDIRLMSFCKHHIIANSSFSWWGAWLNSSIEKIVVAPKQWFANETSTQDLIPYNWVVL